MVDRRRVIRLSNQLMDVLMEGWEASMWEQPRPLPGLLPGQLRELAEMEPAMEAVLAATAPEVIEEMERWWREVDHYHPLVVQEHGGSHEELAQLLAVSDLGRQQQMVQDDSLFQFWGLAVRLLEESKRWRFKDAHRTTDLAMVAVTVAQLLEPDHYEPRWVADLEARCWAHVGNGRRILGELRSAGEAFTRAERLLGQGTGRTLPRVRVAALLASLLIEQRELGRARSVLETVVECYRELNLGREEGRALLQLAKVTYQQGDSQATILTLKAGARRLDADRDPELYFLTQKNLALSLVEAGRPKEAQTILVWLKPPTLPLLLRGLWVKGKILESLDQLAAAGTIYRQLRQVYLKRELGLDAALVSLDLAVLYLKQGETAKVKELAREIYPLFMLQGVEREALAALLVFRRAAEEEVMTLDLATSLSKFLKRFQR